MASPTIQFKRGAFVNLPDLLAGEPGFTTDFYDFYVGTAGVGTVTNQFFGSGRYWERETASAAAKLKLFESTGGGTNSLTFQAPNSLAGVGTFIFPNTNDGQAGDALVITGVTNGVYTLEWTNATAGAVSGISVRDEGGAALPEGASGIGSVVTVDFVGAGISAAFDNGTQSGVATVRVYTASAAQEGTARFDSSDFIVTGGLVELSPNLSFTGVTTFTNVNVTGVTTTLTLNVTGNTTIGDAAGDSLTVNATSTFNAPITGTISTATRSTTVDTTLTTANAEYYPVFVDTNASATGETIRVDSDGLTYNPSSNVLTVPTLDVVNIRHTNDTTALTIDTSGNVTAAQNFTISGSLFVNGTTTQVNTTTLTVEDSLIDIGFVNGSPPGSDLNIDLGILMSWYDTEARKAAVFWDDSTGRIAIAQSVTEASSILTVADWASVEMGQVWINDTAGQNAVMSYLTADTLYTGQTAGRYLQNITVDGGLF